MSFSCSTAALACVRCVHSQWRWYRESSRSISQDEVVAGVDAGIDSAADAIFLPNTASTVDAVLDVEVAAETDEVGETDAEAEVEGDGDGEALQPPNEKRSQASHGSSLLRPLVHLACPPVSHQPQPMDWE